MNKAIIFDLDGTIYYGSSLAYFALEIIELLKKHHYEILFFTNNSTKTREEIYQKLSNLSIKTTINRVYTSAYATAIYLKEHQINNVFLIGTESFKKELNSFNISIVDEYKAEAVIIGLDTKFNYETIAKALIAVNNGAKIIASNKDANYPAENGILKPGSNAILGSLLGATNKNDVHFVAGKPNVYLLEIICKDFKLHKDNIYVIGDSIESDIAMANNYGCKSILVDSKINTLKSALNTILPNKERPT